MTPAKVQKLIQKHGREISLTSKSTTPVDPDKPWLGTTTPAPVPVFALTLDPSSARGLGIATTYEDLKEKSENIYAIAPGVNVKSFSGITDGEDYGIDFAYELRPGTTTLLWYVGASR